MGISIIFINKPVECNDTDCENCCEAKSLKWIFGGYNNNIEIENLIVSCPKGKAIKAGKEREKNL